MIFAAQIALHRMRKFCISSMFVGCMRSVIYLSFVSASSTHLFLPLDRLYRSGNSIARHDEVNQGEFQKEARLLFPKVTIVALSKRALSALSHGSSDLFQGFSSFCQANHNHLWRRALENFPRSCIPSPPFSVGVQIFFHATLQCPAVRSFSCAQRKWRQILSISLSNFFGVHSTDMAKVRIAESTHRTNTLLSANGINLPFQPANLALIRPRMN